MSLIKDDSIWCAAYELHIGGRHVDVVVININMEVHLDGDVLLLRPRLSVSMPNMDASDPVFVPFSDALSGYGIVTTSYRAVEVYLDMDPWETHESVESCICAYARGRGYSLTSRYSSRSEMVTRTTVERFFQDMLHLILLSKTLIMSPGQNKAQYMKGYVDLMHWDTSGAEVLRTLYAQHFGESRSESKGLTGLLQVERVKGSWEP